MKFASLPRETLFEKLEGMKLAQRILLPDHSQTLLVPALIKETLATNNRDYVANGLKRAEALLVRNGIIREERKNY